MKDKEIKLWGDMDILDWLQILFIAFKLANIVDWSWWLVLCPILVKLGVGITALIIILIVSFISSK